MIKQVLFLGGKRNNLGSTMAMLLNFFPEVLSLSQN